MAILRRRKKKAKAEKRPVMTFSDVLDVAREAAGGVRPTPEGGKKTKYATHFANSMAVLIAKQLRDDYGKRFEEVKPDAEGGGVESPSQALHGLKKLDVNYSTPQAGLGIGVSLKSVHVRDVDPKQRFHHNMKRNDEELRAEAAGYHQRQPYAVLVAVLFLPFEACEDTSGAKSSSFGTWVQYLWPLGNREEPQGDFDRFERVFIGLYDPQTAELGFFDVKTPPPRVGRPDMLLSLESLVAEIVETFDKRNALDFRWADGTRDPSID
jgi:hypothetical protein